MNMKLHIHFPKNLVTESLLRQKKIPCLCRIGKNFEILFQHPLPEALGTVEGWDIEEVLKRAPAGAGGQYTYYSFSAVTLREIKSNLYQIIDWDLFNRSVGWCHILVNGEYAPPGNFGDDEEDLIGR